MKQDIALDLIDRLRSGKYTQGHSVLRSTTDDGAVKNCCLGIVCDMAVEAGVITSPVVYETWAGETSYSYGDEENGFNHAVLPEVVKDWAGFYTDNGSFVPDSDADQEMQEHHCLSGFNDTGVTFPEIADIVERYWEDL